MRLAGNRLSLISTHSRWVLATEGLYYLKSLSSSAYHARIRLVLSQPHFNTLLGVLGAQPRVVTIHT
jgi:hypothetical protein